MTSPFNPLAPWDRKTRFVEPSSNYVPGLYKFPELAARDILNNRAVLLNNWEAQFLQGVLYRPRRLTELEHARLNMLERRHGGAGGRMTMKTYEGYDTGWSYSQSGTPVSYIMPPGEPSKAIHIPHDTWWQALRFSLHFAEDNGCEIIGGPDNGL